MNDSFMNSSSSDDGIPYAINTSLRTNVGEGQPLNSSNNSSNLSNSTTNIPNFFSGFNPALYNQVGYLNMMFPGWPSGHHMFPYTRSTGATSRMDIDSTNPGDWVAIPEHRMLQHIHRDNCVILLQANEAAQHAKAKLTSVESKLSSIMTDYENRLTAMDSNFNGKYHELHEKYNNALDEKSQLIVEITDLKEKIIATIVKVKLLLALGWHPTLDAMVPIPFPLGNATPRHLDHLLLELNIVTAETLLTPTLILNGDISTYLSPIEKQHLVPLSTADIAPDNSIPNPTVFSQGSSLGIQTIPTTPEILSDLMTQAGVDGNFEALYKLRYALCFAQLLEQTADYAPHFSPYHGSEKDILSKSCEVNPTWAKCSKFLDQSEYWVNTIPAEWDEFIEIPAVSNPGDVINRHNYMQWAEWIFIHGDVTIALGLVFSDTGSYDIECIRAYRILSFLTPSHGANKRDSYDTFCFTMVSFLSKAGLYEELLQKYNLVVAPSIHLARATGSPPYDYQYMAKLFADCGLSITTINSMLRFAWQFCIDMQTLTTNPPQVKANYAVALNKARF
ncbi:hypothetical protein L218DRAFT_951252 [Marasmius fiardii PR-910]|nr:hypothetical protein L218DRAFT_951252 [Marasmius fiardii PR-910]